MRCIKFAKSVLVGLRKRVDAPEEWCRAVEGSCDQAEKRRKAIVDSEKKRKASAAAKGGARANADLFSGEPVWVKVTEDDGAQASAKGRGGKGGGGKSARGRIGGRVGGRVGEKSGAGKEKVGPGTDQRGAQGVGWR